MNALDFKMTFFVHSSPEEAFKTILDVRSWWRGLYDEDIEGKSDVLNEEFTFRAGAGVHYSKHQLIEATPNKKIVWRVSDGNLTFIQNKKEWVNTRICFEISEKDNQTQITFTHEGLVPELECYNACSATWTKYLQEKLMKVLSVYK
jgi:hypothetical protein